jgi:hypothetical protein
VLSFENATVHNIEGVQESLASFGSRRMKHPPFSPDLPLCGFFLFGVMKQAFGGQHFDTIDDLFLRVEAFLEDLLRTSYRPVFSNGYGNCSSVMRVAENTSSGHDKIGSLLL